jgi:hypothetical protein
VWGTLDWSRQKELEFGEKSHSTVLWRKRCIVRGGAVDQLQSMGQGELHLALNFRVSDDTVMLCLRIS